MIVAIDSGAAPVGIAEAKAWLRLGAGLDDAVVAGLIRSAADLCEAFTGQLLIARRVREELPMTGGRMRLAKRPVVAIETVEGLVAGAPDVALAADGWTHAIDRDGAARLSIVRPDDAERVRVVYRAGMASEPNGVPEAVRQGLIRMVQHLHAARHGAGDIDAREPPAIVAALWQPWRRQALGAGQ